MPSWVHTFASACLSRRCYSPGTASYLADSQRLTGYLVDPEGLPVSLDPSSIPSYSFHGAHIECTTVHRRSSDPNEDRPLRLIRKRFARNIEDQIDYKLRILV